MRPSAPSSDPATQSPSAQSPSSTRVVPSATGSIGAPGEGNQRGWEASSPHSQPKTSSVSTDKRYAASEKFLELFQATSRRANGDVPPVANGQQVELRVAWICHPMPYHQESINLAMKVGPKNTYVVKRIRDFLESVNDSKPFFFTPNFSYLADVHRFSEIDAKIIHILLDILHDEASYRKLFGYYSTSPSTDRNRAMWIPPKKWKALYPLLAEANAIVQHVGLNDVLRIGDTPPISGHIASRKQGDYALRLEGLEDLQVLPDYSCAIRGATLYPLDEATANQLASMKRMMAYEHQSDILIPAESLTRVVNEVLPQLRRVGQIDMAKNISKRIVEAPLKAKLYLDWWNGDGEEHETLRARLQFTYGDITVSPAMDSGSGAGAGVDDHDSQTIVVRDVAAEQRIVDYLQQASHVHHSGEFLISDEDDIYTFLFEALPELQELVDVYTTDAVDTLTKPSPTPRSRVDLDERTNWLDVSFDIAGLDDGEIRGVLRAIVEKKKYHRLRDGQFLSLEQGAYAEYGTLLENLAIRETDLRGKRASGTAEPTQGDEGLSIRLPALRALPMMDVQAGQGVKLGKSLRDWLDNLRNPDNLDVPIPSDLKATLRAYQTFGFQWMKTLAKYGFGGILADDMGLGKTIQSIAFLLSDKEEQQSIRTGKATGEATGNATGTATDKAAAKTTREAADGGEMDNHDPSHRPALIVCPASLMYNWMNEMETFAPSLKAVVVAGNVADRRKLLEDTANIDVCITSYPLLRRDAEDYAARPFRTLILDEAQAIKNHSTQTAQAARMIQSDLRFALTGTPIENAIDDLWSIFHTLFPDLLGSHKSFSSLSPEVVAKRVRPFILRRLKRDVLTELPEKIETLQTSELTADQKKLYLAYLARLQQDTKEGLANEGFQKGRLRILAGLTRLRQICCHPSLCVEDYRGQSGKLEQLMELVQEYTAANQRMLIFSQFTSMLHVIQEALDKKGIDYFYLDGDTPVKERLKLCQSFNEGTVPVFLISLKAGGTGLNLTGADTVILYDLWWNPAVEQQAADRAHRIGQKRTVQVIRMVAKGSIEEKMYELQQRKRDLIDTVVESGSDRVNSLTEEDVRELLQI